jgi:hypothetical protein
MKKPRQPNRLMLVGAAVFICIGALMVVEGIVHVISGEPIPATTWTQETTGPEQLVLGLIGVGLGIVALRLAFREPPQE